MEISIERRAPSAEPGKEIQFSVSVRSLNTHTHGELTRCDQAEIRRLLALLADEVEAVLQENTPKTPSPHVAANRRPRRGLQGVGIRPENAMCSP